LPRRKALSLDGVQFVGDRLEGLHADPEFANRGIGTDLLRLLEALVRERGLSVMHAQASSMRCTFVFDVATNCVVLEHRIGLNRSQNACVCRAHWHKGRSGSLLRVPPVPLPLGQQTFL
jgi:GNAT superfamily N-acetyltransferase